MPDIIAQFDENGGVDQRNWEDVARPFVHGWLGKPLPQKQVEVSTVNVYAAFQGSDDNGHPIGRCKEHVAVRNEPSGAQKISDKGSPTLNNFNGNTRTWNTWW